MNSELSTDLGICVSESDLNYPGDRDSSWSGFGLVNKPISELHVGIHNAVMPALFAGSMSLRIIPEPKEYAIAFGLFALGFVFFHRQIQKS